MGNRSVFDIYHPDGKGIRGFETNNNIGPAWFIMLDPPAVQVSEESSDELGEDVYKAVLDACQSDGARVKRNWNTLARLQGRGPILDRFIKGSHSLIEPIAEHGNGISYSADIGEYAMFGDEHIRSLIIAWQTIHLALRGGDVTGLRAVLITMADEQWGLGLDGKGAHEIEQLVSARFSSEQQDMWSIVMCAWDTGPTTWDTMMGWGSGVKESGAEEREPAAAENAHAADGPATLQTVERSPIRTPPVRQKRTVRTVRRDTASSDILSDMAGTKETAQTSSFHTQTGSFHSGNMNYGSFHTILGRDRDGPLSFVAYIELVREHSIFTKRRMKLFLAMIITYLFLTVGVEIIVGLSDFFQEGLFAISVLLPCLTLYFYRCHKLENQDYRVLNDLTAYSIGVYKKMERTMLLALLFMFLGIGVINAATLNTAIYDYNLVLIVAWWLIYRKWIQKKLFLAMHRKWFLV